MMDLRLFQNRLFSVNLLTGFMVFIAMSGTILLMPFYLEGILGHTTEQVGLLMAVVPLATGLIAPFSGSLSDRIGTRPMTVAGLGVLVMGFLAVSTLSLTTTSLGYILRFLPVGLGLGIFQSPNNSRSGAAPRDRLGVVSGLLALTRTVGQTTGIALGGSPCGRGGTLVHAGQVYPGGATTAPATAQVMGLHNVLLALAGLLVVALGLAAWALMESRRQAQTMAQTVSN